MIIRISLLLFFLNVIPAAYIYNNKIRHLNKKTPKILFLLPNIILLILTIYFTFRDSHIAQHADALGIFLSVFLLITIPEFIYSVALLFSQFIPNDKIQKITTLTGTIISSITALIVIIGFWSCFLIIKVEEHDFYSKDLPKSFDGYRIVHITDLHLGTYHLFPNTVKRIISKVNEQNGDVIFFTGDLVNFTHTELIQFQEDLKHLHAKDGIYSILGNHDYIPYIHYKKEESREKDIQKLIQMQYDMGWKLLLNENDIIKRNADSIFIIGSENDGIPPFPARGDLQKALKGTDEKNFKILLTHDPTQWRRKILSKTNIQLTLSGHTHAGQIKAFGLSPSACVFKEWDGAYRSNDQTLFISSGIGEALVPFRFGAWPKIDIITLHTTK